MFQDNLLLPFSRYKKEYFLDCLSFEDGTYRLSQNIGNYSPTYAALQLRRVKIYMECVKHRIEGSCYVCMVLFMLLLSEQMAKQNDSSYI
jgi:hypothetical protein